ncbi:DUF6567 family protein [uncultured Imperialibacter sp.]|uniref:DUF6567 family protein n=1 Tax=uncultured Imperialibacter sp. TaxID=1672639 RepID=UPI0030D7FC01
MKKSISTIAVMIMMVVVSSCGAGRAIMSNQNQSSTQVHLKENNFKVIRSVSGSAEAKYWVLIGGRKRQQMYNEAYAEMVKSAELIDGPRALVNLLTEEHVGGVPPFFLKRTITVSGHVVEFNR